MPEMTSYDPGVPCWVDLASGDVAGAVRFYEDLFGWKARDLGPEAGGYTMLELNGREVGAVGPKQNPQQPTAWSTYLATDDADALAARVTANGGTVMAPPFDVMQAGRMGVFADPTGAVFCVWQPGEHRGAGVANEAGAFCWNELATRDPERAADFYGKVAGLGAKKSEGPFDYWELQAGGRSVAGMMRMTDDRYPAEVPPHWLVYFGAADVDASTAKAASLGATTVVPPMDIPGVGRFSVVMDPQGAAFALFQMG